MRWEDERYVRLYTRETPEWAVLSWEARAVFHELIKRVDRAGILLVGKSGIRGLAGLLRMPLDVVDRGLNAEDGLLADGCVQTTNGGYILPNFMAAQEAKQSDKARKQEQRARDRAARLQGGLYEVDDAKAEWCRTRRINDLTPQADCVFDVMGVTNRDQQSRVVTERHDTEGSVRGSHDPSPEVTPSLAVPSRTEPSQDEDVARAPVASPAPTRASTTTTTTTTPACATTERVLQELRRQPKLASIATEETAAGIVGFIQAGTRLEDAVESIRALAFDLVEGSKEVAIRRALRSYLSRAKSIGEQRRSERMEPPRSRGHPRPPADPAYEARERAEREEVLAEVRNRREQERAAGVENDF